MTATMIMASVAPDPPSGEIPNIRSIKSIACLPVCICAYAQCDVLAMRPAARLTHRLIGRPSGKCDVRTLRPGPRQLKINRPSGTHWPSGAPLRPNGRVGLGVLRHTQTSGRYYDKAVLRLTATVTSH